MRLGLMDFKLQYRLCAQFGRLPQTPVSNGKGIEGKKEDLYEASLLLVDPSCPARVAGKFKFADVPDVHASERLRFHDHRSRTAMRPSPAHKSRLGCCWSYLAVTPPVSACGQDTIWPPVGCSRVRVRDSGPIWVVRTSEPGERRKSFFVLTICMNGVTDTLPW